MDYQNHPLNAVLQIADLYPDIDTFSFSKYRHQPDSSTDDRTEFSLIREDLCPEVVSDVVHSLEPDEELAIHSHVCGPTTSYHIPMIDFACTPEAINRVWTRLRRHVDHGIIDTLSIYHSGRSCHGYSTKLLSKTEWDAFMYSLLLVNISGDTAFIDTRWVGHRLLAGYCSLRWTKNTLRYLTVPTVLAQAA